MPRFLIHRFNVKHTKDQLSHIIENLAENEVLLIQDFSENYSCLLPVEPMSIHWTTEQATVYPVVELRKVDVNTIKEDHFVFTSDDKTHDPAFVECCFSCISSFYQERLGADVSAPSLSW